MVDSGSFSKTYPSYGEIERVWTAEPSDFYAFRNTKKINPSPAEFSLFPKLIPELRCKIWYFVAHSTPRILEIQTVRESDGSRACKEYKVTSKTSRTPTIMHINRESRTEAMRIYRKYIFSASDDVVYSWFNPHLDIIYFSLDRCTRIIDILLRRYPDITKVAFPCRWSISSCQDCGFHDSLGSDINPFRIWRACECRFTTRGALPAVPVSYTGSENHTRSEPVPGANIPEVFFVLETRLRSSQLRGIDLGVTFCPPPHAYEVLWSRFTQQMQAISTARKGEENNCFTCMDTKVNFVSFAPPVKQSRGIDLKHSVIMIPSLDFSKLDFLKEPFPELLSRTGCEIESMSVRPTFTYEVKAYELGIYNGTDEGIEEVKRAIKKKIEDASS